MIYCPKCGTANRDGSRFCNECGGRLDQGVGVMCPNCSAPNPFGTQHCSKCGAPLMPSAIGFPDQADKPDYEEAPSRGAPSFAEECESEPAVSVKALPEWLYEEETEPDMPAPVAMVSPETTEAPIPGSLEGSQEVHAEAKSLPRRAPLSIEEVDRAPISGPLAGIAGVLPLPEEYTSGPGMQGFSPVRWWPRSAVEEIEPAPVKGQSSRLGSRGRWLLAGLAVAVFFALVLLGIFIAQGIVHVPGS